MIANKWVPRERLGRVGGWERRRTLQRWTVTTSVSFRTALQWVLLQPIPMRMNDMTPKQLSSVPCPRCGVATGKSCLQPSGALRDGPHVDRRLSAIEAVELKRDYVVAESTRRQSSESTFRVSRVYACDVNSKAAFGNEGTSSRSLRK